MIKTLKKQLIPIMLMTVVVSAILSIYFGRIFVITLLSFAAQVFFFLYFDQVKKKGAHGAVLYCIALFVIINSVIILITIQGKPVDFVIWILTARSGETVGIPYGTACFLSVNFLVASFLYYFTQVVYRSLYVLMVTIMPLALYAKRYDAINNIYIVLLMVFYIAVMLHCRKIMIENNPAVVMNTGRLYLKSSFQFIILTITVALLIPKPEITPFREEVDALAGKAGAQIGLSDALGIFTDKSGSGLNTTNNTVLYRVAASENLYLRRQTFDLYNGSSWTYMKQYGDTGTMDWNADNDKLDFTNFTDVLKTVGVRKKAFFQKYHLDILTGKEVVPNAKAVQVTLNNHKSRIILSVNNIQNISGLDNVYGTLNNDLFLGNQMSLFMADTYTIHYYSEEADRRNQSITFAKQFNQSTYKEMLTEAASYYSNSSQVGDQERLDIIREYRNEEKKAGEYYNVTYQLPSKKIKELAETITAGLQSDYDKAKALEDYFTVNGFVYDLSYKPGKGNEGAEYFIFNSRRGTCSSYATAMTLMARAIGLPARYVEGFAVDEKENEFTYLVRDKDSHAYTEVFISGYGWMTFDATVSASEEDDRKAVKSLTVSWMDMLNFAIFLASALVLVVIGRMAWPVLMEISFRIQLKCKKEDDAMLYLYRHLKKLVGRKQKIQTEGLTARMLEDLIARIYYIRISEITEAFEKVCYGGKILTEEEFQNIYETYLSLYKALKKNKALPYVGTGAVKSV